MTSRTFTVVPEPHRLVQYVSNVLSGKTLVAGRAGVEACAPRTWIQHACFNPRGAPSAATKQTVDVASGLRTLLPLTTAKGSEASRAAHSVHQPFRLPEGRVVPCQANLRSVEVQVGQHDELHVEFGMGDSLCGPG